ncbi:MAG: ABC transporter permease [Alkalispirochaetaceae bacterium]
MSTSSTTELVTDREMEKRSSRTPPLAHRLFSVWYRHVRVYSKNLISNALPPFLEPLVFLVGIGLGLGTYINEMNGFPYLDYLASGLLVTAAMFTAAFECTFGTFIRLEFDKVYDGMLAAPITVNNLLVGEILWAGTKGFVFTFSVMVVIAVFGVLPLGQIILTPFVGFLTGAMFASLGLLVTAFVKTINHFNFFFSGVISPMFFFSGVVFPVENLPPVVRPITEILPLTHSVRLARGLALNQLAPELWWDLAYVLVVTVGVGYLAILKLKGRLVD